MKQQIQLRRREVDETADLPAELPPLLRRLYASRGVRSAQELERSVKGMLPWQQLSGVEKAVEILTTLFAKERGLLWSVISTPTVPPARL